MQETLKIHLKGKMTHLNIFLNQFKWENFWIDFIQITILTKLAAYKTGGCYVKEDLKLMSSYCSRDLCGAQEM